MLQLSFIWQTKENTSSRCEGSRTQNKRGAKFWLLFLYFFFLLPLSLPYVNWASQKGYLFHLRYSILPLDLPLFNCLGLLHSLSFSHHHFGLFLPILTTYQSLLKRWEAQFMGVGTSKSLWLLPAEPG